MGRRSKKPKQPKVPNRKERTLKPSGYDIGDLNQIILTAPSYFEFNNELIKAEISGCAYGAHKKEGYDGYLPLLSLLAKKPEHLSKAFEYFYQWGVKNDGDAVDISIILRKNGEYILGIQPNYERLDEHIMPDRDLADPMYSGVTWIKRIDTTNEILREWKAELRSRLFPILIDGASVSMNGANPVPGSIKPIDGVSSFLKFKLKIIEEADEPNHFMLKVVDNQLQGNARGPMQARRTPQRIASARRRIIDSVFPVTRERIRRKAIYSAVKCISTYSEVSQSQVEQGVINLMMSRRWLAGAEHYVGVDNVKEWFFNRVVTYSEHSMLDNEMDNLSLESIIKQIELDVVYSLRLHGANFANKFRANQKFYMRLGYGHP